VGYVLLVRHAQSTWNALGRWQGQADPPLSEEGLAQAARAATVLAGRQPFDLVVSSDLERALRTAAILAEAAAIGAAHIVEPGLREYDVGDWSGLAREEIVGRWPDELDRFSRGGLRAPPGGEDRDEFDSRVRDATERVARAASAAGASRVLLVSHGGVLRSMARLHRVPEYRATQLAGYHGELTEAGLAPVTPVDLLEGDRGPDSPAAGSGGDVVDGAIAL